VIHESHNAVVARNEPWRGSVATEPYEVGWAHEAIIFVHALEKTYGGHVADARVQISPDGMRWVDEGTSFRLPANQGETTFVRVREFGAWLRIAAQLPEGTAMKVLVTISLKA
jgi:hypothetical protein